MYLTKVRVNSETYPTQRCYPFNIPILGEPSELVFRKRVVFFVGENGSGKSTLLEAITRKCGIHIWDKPKRHVAHHNPYEDRLKDYITVTWSNGHVAGSLFRAETFYDLADFLDDVALCDPGRLKYHGGQLLNTLSHGEGILSYFSGRYHVKGLYILDEPEAALSPASQVKFLQLLQQLEAQGHAQFIIATHSPILLACPGAQIFSFDSSHIEEVRYEETTHYRIYRQFLTDRSAFLQS
ncbi:MAG TPA: ATP-binding cassette domain-containing protein [Chloroflexi bacterium]|mgnify:CR=1 FL=1|nr:ATP-binding cassette domain-containing protein [Chloroflexota bacterium]